MSRFHSTIFYTLRAYVFIYFLIIIIIIIFLKDQEKTNLYSKNGVIK